MLKGRNGIAKSSSKSAMKFASILCVGSWGNPPKIIDVQNWNFLDRIFEDTFDEK
jgi:hypothetical protein